MGRSATARRACRIHHVWPQDGLGEPLRRADARGDHPFESGLAGALSSFFLWLAENIGTLTGTWVYAGKHISSFANLSKMGSWYLLLYVAFIQVTFVVRPRSDELAAEGNESNHADHEQCVETGPAGPAQHRGGAFPTPIEAAQVSHDGGGGALGPHPVDQIGRAHV